MISTSNKNFRIKGKKGIVSCQGNNHDNTCFLRINLIPNEIFKFKTTLKTALLLFPLNLKDTLSPATGC